MSHQSCRYLPELLNSYRQYLSSKLNKVRILGEIDERELRDVFVELMIADPKQRPEHAEFLGMLHTETRFRFNLFDENHKHILNERLKGQKRIDRYIRPDELLRRKTKAIVTGTPGCGKTTLLKYLALQALDKEQRLVIWFELKAIDEILLDTAAKAAARKGSFIVQELWLLQLTPLLSLRDSEIRLLRSFWQEKFTASELAILMDGFDEIQDTAIQTELNKCVGEFTSSLHDNTLLISTRPYARHKLATEYLHELEIQPLNKRQIVDFLNCYYPGEVAAKSLIKALRTRSPIKELLSVPLLLGLILRLHRENNVVQDRLKLYKIIISDLINELDRSKSVFREFKIKNVRLRLDFLKFVSFERLLCDSLAADEREVNRVLFNYDLLKDKAKAFLSHEGLSYHARDLADDALATPLLREVGSDMFAFTHLTLQEYLAAQAFVPICKQKGNNGLKLFCRAYHNPIIVEMEVLPMILGYQTDANDFYDEIERWPESLTFTNLRLRARGLSYSASISKAHSARLIDRLFEFLSGDSLEATAYKELVINSFLGLFHQEVALIDEKASSLLEIPTQNSMSIVETLARMGSAKGFNKLVSGLQDDQASTRVSSARILGTLGEEKALEPLIAALRDSDPGVRRTVAEALGNLGTERAVQPLIGTIEDPDSGVRKAAVETLGRLGSDDATKTLISCLQDQETSVRVEAATALGKLGTEKVIHELTVASKHRDVYVRARAVQALGAIRSDKAIDVLSSALEDEDDVWTRAISALRAIGSSRAIEILISASTNHDSYMRMKAVQALGSFDSEKVANSLILRLADDDDDVKWRAVEALEGLAWPVVVRALTQAFTKVSNLRCRIAQALGSLRSPETVATLILGLKDESADVRQCVAKALQKIGSDKAVDSLITSLRDKDKDVRKAAADALGGIRSHRATGSLIAAMDDSDETVRVSVVGALRQLRPTEAIDFLSSLLDQESRELRVEIASLLTEIGSDKGLDALIEAFCNDGVLAERSAVALAEIGSPKAVKTLVAALHSSNYISRFNAIRALKDIGSKEAESVLIQAVKDNVLRHDAISMLVELKSETALEYLSSLMTDKDDHVVTEAVAALGQYHSSGAVEILIGSICHKSSLVQDDIADALSRIDVETLTVCFGRALNHTNDCVRQRVASIIGYYSIDDLTLDQLTSLSQSDGAFQVRAVAKTAAEGFARKLELLGNIQSNVASPPLNDNESRELFLLGETFKIVAEAGHIFRPTPNSDWGIDGEIEFKNESGEASGFRVYLQLKSGDSHIRQNKRNRKEIFTIKNPRHARFWMSHAYPVLLVIRDSSGRIRWMNVTAYLREHGANTKQIEFKGEPFTAANIREMHNRFACQS